MIGTSMLISANAICSECDGTEEDCRECSVRETCEYIMENLNIKPQYRVMTDDEQTVYNNISASDAQKTGINLFNA